MQLDGIFIAAWLEAKKNLSAMKSLELVKRNILIVLAGTEKSGKIADYKWKVTTSISYKLDSEQIQADMNQLCETEMDGLLNEAELACIKTVYEIKPGLYNKLPDDSVLRKYVTAKPGQSAFSAEYVVEED